MEKQLIAGVLAVLILGGMAFAPVDEYDAGIEEIEEIKITYILKFDQSAFESFNRQSVDRGINPSDFGRFVAGNGIGSVTIDMGPIDGLWDDRAQLVIMKIDPSGRVLAEQSVDVQISERGAPLRSPQIPSVFDRMFQGSGDILFPASGDNFFPVPGNNFYPVDSLDRAKRAFIQDAQRLTQRLGSSNPDIVGVGLLLLPHPDNSYSNDRSKSVSVTLNGHLFIKNTATS